MRRAVVAVGVMVGVVVAAFVAVALDAPKARQMDEEWGCESDGVVLEPGAALRAQLVNAARLRAADALRPK